jgi:hypothetical protein
MARVLPFRAVTPASPASAGRLWQASQPLSDAERRALLADASHGLHLAQALDPRAQLSRWLASGQLQREARPSFHVLEVQAPRWGEAPARFVFGLVPAGEALTPLEEGAKPVAAPLVEPTLALAADDHGVLRELLAEVAESAPVVLEGTLEERRWRLLHEEAGARTRRLQGVLEEGLVRPLAPLEGSGPHLTAVLPLSESGFRLRSVHRALRGVETFREDTFLALVAGYARVQPLDAPLTSARGLAEARERLATQAAGTHAVLLVLPGGQGRVLRFRQRLDLGQIKAVPRNPTLRSLDLALLNALVLRTVLGLKDPELPAHPQVFTVGSLEELVEGVEAGTYQVGFGLNPPPVWEVRAVMEAHETLPPRTLRVDPMPPAGLLFGDPEA